MRYLTLDLMRGLAALAVLVFHADYMIGLGDAGLTRGYLAVDFFFVLSGFVIAANYHATVRPDLEWGDFLAARIARLWPLFFVATLAGFLAVNMKATRDFGYFDAPNVFYALACNVFMLPSPFQSYGIDRPFVFNGASWSVFLEVVINLVFFAVLRRLQFKPLLALTAVFALVLAAAAYVNGSLDGGWSSQNYYVGGARVLFGFTAGMAVYLFSLRSRMLLGTPALFATVGGLLLSFFADGGWVVDVILAAGVFPMLVLFAARGEFGKTAAAIGARLGDVSYSVYLLQTPAMLFVSWAFRKLTGHNIADFAPWSGLAFIAVVLGVSTLSWRYFELPARSRMRRRLGSPRRPARAAPEGAA